MLLLNIDRKPYMGSPVAPSHFTLRDLERSMSRSLGFQSLISCKGAELGHILPSTTNRKAYMTSSHLTLSEPVKSKSRSFRILSGNRAVCYTHICQYCITTVVYMSQKGLMQAGGVCRCPLQRSFLLFSVSPG